MPSAKAVHERPTAAEADVDGGWGWWRPRLPGVAQDAILVSLSAARVGGDNYRGASVEYLFTDYLGVRLTGLFDPDPAFAISPTAVPGPPGTLPPSAQPGPSAAFHHIEQLGFTLHPRPMHHFDFWLGAGLAHFGQSIEGEGVRTERGEVLLHLGAGARIFFHRFFVGLDGSFEPVELFHWMGSDNRLVAQVITNGPTGSRFLGSLEIGFRF
jgi:hypothetical protein